MNVYEVYNGKYVSLTMLGKCVYMFGNIVRMESNKDILDLLLYHLNKNVSMLICEYISFFDYFEIPHRFTSGYDMYFGNPSNTTITIKSSGQCVIESITRETDKICGVWCT